MRRWKRFELDRARVQRQVNQHLSPTASAGREKDLAHHLAALLVDKRQPHRRFNAMQPHDAPMPGETRWQSCGQTAPIALQRQRMA